MPTIIQEQTDTEEADSEETISIISTSMADHFEKYGMSEALNMIAYHYQQLSEGYSQLVAVKSKLAPGKITVALAQLLPEPSQAPMTSRAGTVLTTKLSLLSLSPKLLSS